MEGVRPVCDEDCSKSFGTAGRQTLPAARQRLADQADSSCSACSVAETRPTRWRSVAVMKPRHAGDAYANLSVVSFIAMIASIVQYLERIFYY